MTTKSMTKEELIDTLRSMAVGYQGAAAKIEGKPQSWVTDRPRDLCEAYAISDAFLEFSKALIALAEEGEKETPISPEDLPC